MIDNFRNGCTNTKMSSPRTIVITLPKPLPLGAQVKGIITPESINGYMANKSSSPMFSACNIIQVVKEERIEPISGKCSRYNNEDKQPRKRQKLDHLSFDEKLMRRKLKNRVAAQSARDRKKVRMDELEEQVSKLSDKITTLSTVVETLSQHNAQLEDEKELLQKRLSQCTCTCIKSKKGNFVSDKVSEERKTPVCSVTVKSAELPQPRAIILQAAFRALFLTFLYSQTKSPLEEAKAWLTSAAKENVAIAKPLLQKLSACHSNEELHKWMGHHQPPWIVEVFP